MTRWHGQYLDEIFTPNQKIVVQKHLPLSIEKIGRFKGKLSPALSKLGQNCYCINSLRTSCLQLCSRCCNLRSDVMIMDTKLSCCSRNLFYKAFLTGKEGKNFYFLLLSSHSDVSYAFFMTTVWQVLISSLLQVKKLKLRERN